MYCRFDSQNLERGIGLRGRRQTDGTNHEEGRPDVDLAGALVEEEHVLDEHEAGDLGHGAEEAVQDARRHERVEGRGAGTPGGCGRGHDEEPEHDGQTADVGAQDNNWSWSASFLLL